MYFQTSLLNVVMSAKEVNLSAGRAAQLILSLSSTFVAGTSRADVIAAMPDVMMQCRNGLNEEYYQYASKVLHHLITLS